MHKTTPKDWEDLKTLMKQAYLVAGDMASLPYEWRFDFPRCGIPYQTTMINRDPYIHDLTDQQIANRRLPVRLGFIPAVYWRDNSNGQIKTGQLIRPQVLIVHPNKTPTKTPNHTPNHIPFHTPNQTITPTHGRSI